MMQGPHTRTVVVVNAPIIFLVLKGLHECVIFSTLHFLWGLAIPCAVIIGLLLLFLHFLGQCFLGGLFLAHWLRLGILDSSAPTFCFQKIDLCSHGHDLFLFFSGFTPSVFCVKESSFIFVLCMHHEVFCHEGGSSIVALAFQILDVDHEFIVWSSLVCLLEII